MLRAQMRLELLAVPCLKAAEDTGEHHRARVVGVDVGLQHIHVAGLEGAGGAALLVSVKFQLVTFEILSRSKQLPTDFAFELSLLVISADVVEEAKLVVGRKVTVLTLEHF